MQQFRGECDFNETPFQAQDSTACGEFCVYFAIHRYFDIDLDFGEIVRELFSNDFQANEGKVKDFVELLKGREKNEERYK